MFDTLIKSFAPRAIQDLITSIAGILVAHGFMTADQTQGFIGSAFFLAMLIVNYFIAQHRKANAAQVGAAVAGADLPRSTALNIAKGKIP
jgi:hypothetical protein